LDVQPPHFVRLTLLDRVFNTVVGALVGFGIGPSHIHVLEVRGRKTGRVYSLPVDLLTADGGALFLVAPRGYTQWVRNAEAQGEVTLRRGRRSVRFQLRPLAETEKPPVLKEYLDRFHREVQGFFPIPHGAPAHEFEPLVARYPAFELLPASRD
jgi:deazaflavin-dependent oxidoreductase (nitroreductase family)